jgi:hypothetical protein
MDPSDLKIQIDNDEPKHQPSRKRRSSRQGLIIGLIIVGIIATVIFVRPAFIGFSVYDNVRKSGLTVEDYTFNIERISQELAASESSLAACQSELALEKEAMENQRSLTDEKVLALEGVQEELDSTVKAVRQRDTEVLVLQDMLEETKTKLERKSDDYDDLVKNTARSICCKNKIDNPNINFFDVDDDRIVCSETDGEQLSCW